MQENQEHRYEAADLIFTLNFLKVFCGHRDQANL